MKAVTLKFIYAHKKLRNVMVCSCHFRNFSNTPFSISVPQSRSDLIAQQYKAKDNLIHFAYNLPTVCPQQTFVLKFSYHKL